ncbi:MAG: hypothetical protein Q9177_005731 [Variospora cf. flavescens]
MKNWNQGDEAAQSRDRTHRTHSTVIDTNRSIPPFSVGIVCPTPISKGKATDRVDEDVPQATESHHSIRDLPPLTLGSSMSGVYKKFVEALRAEGHWKKLFGHHIPGQRIAMPNAHNNDAKNQLRLDAGEVIDGKKHVNVQINSQASNDALVKYRNSHGSHAKVATAQFDVNTPAEKQEEVFEAVMEDLQGQYSEKIR